MDRRNEKPNGEHGNEAGLLAGNFSFNQELDQICGRQGIYEQYTPEALGARLREAVMGWMYEAGARSFEGMGEFVVEGEKEQRFRREDFDKLKDPRVVTRAELREWIKRRMGELK